MRKVNKLINAARMTNPITRKMLLARSFWGNLLTAIATATGNTSATGAALIFEATAIPNAIPKKMKSRLARTISIPRLTPARHSGTVSFEISAASSGSSSLCLSKPFGISHPVSFVRTRTAKYIVKTVKNVMNVSSLKKCESWICNTVNDENAAANKPTRLLYSRLAIK